MSFRVGRRGSFSSETLHEGNKRVSPYDYSRPRGMIRSNSCPELRHDVPDDEATDFPISICPENVQKAEKSWIRRNLSILITISVAAIVLGAMTVCMMTALNRFGIKSFAPFNSLSSGWLQGLMYGSGAFIFSGFAMSITYLYVTYKRCVAKNTITQRFVANTIYNSWVYNSWVWVEITSINREIPPNYVCEEIRSGVERTIHHRPPLCDRLRFFLHDLFKSEDELPA